MGKKWEKFKNGLSTAAKVGTNLTTVATVASKAYKLAKVVAAVVNAETKIYDIQDVTIGGITLAGQTTTLTQMAEGTDYNQRIGNSIAPHSLSLNMYFTYGNVQEEIRIIIFRDMENRGTGLPSPADLLETGTVNSPLNHKNAGRFKILSDKRLNMDTYHPQLRYKFYHKFPTTAKGRHAHIKFNSNVGTTADIAEGHVFFMTVTNGGTNSGACTYYSRLRYIDN